MNFPLRAEEAIANTTDLVSEAREAAHESRVARHRLALAISARESSWSFFKNAFAGCPASGGPRRPSMSEASGIERGDKVRLKIGGPIMTVETPPDQVDLLRLVRR